MQQGKGKGRGQPELGHHGGEQESGNRSWAIARIPCFSSLFSTLKASHPQLFRPPLLLALPKHAPLRVNFSFPYPSSIPSGPDPSLPVTHSEDPWSWRPGAGLGGVP